MKIRTDKITALVLAVILLIFSLSACVKNETKSDNVFDTAKEEDIISEDDKQSIIKIAEGMLGVDGDMVKEYSGSLGYGYNLLTAAYYNPIDIKASYPIIDMDALAADDYVFIKHLTSLVNSKNFLSHTTREYSQSITTAAKCQGKIGLTGSFAASFEMDYSSEIKSDQVLLSVHSKLFTRRDFIYGTTKSELAGYVTKIFAEDLQSLSPKALFDSYGTHILKDIYMGGRYELNYIYTNESNMSDTDIQASVDASNAWVKGSASAETTEHRKEVEENSEIHILAYGGNVTIDPNSIEKAQNSYPQWAEGVNDGKVAFVDAAEIIPIWDIVAVMDIDNAKELSENLSKYFDSESDKISSDFKDSVSIKQYISSVHIGTGDSVMLAKNVLREQGILEGNIVNVDLNQNAGGRFIYLGYKTTTDPAKALTGISADYFTDANSSDITYKNSKYTIIPTDLNMGSGGDYIYMYHTKDSNAGSPITGIQWQVNNDFQMKTADGYEVVKCTTDGKGMDFNRSVGGDYIYLWFTRN